MEKKKKREKGEIKTKNRKKEGRNAVKRVARRVEQCVINVKREPRANRFERVSLLRTRSPRPLAIFLLFRIQAESKVVLRPPFFDARILKPETRHFKDWCLVEMVASRIFAPVPTDRSSGSSFPLHTNDTLEGQSSHSVKMLSKVLFFSFFSTSFICKCIHIPFLYVSPSRVPIINFWIDWTTS